MNQKSEEKKMVQNRTIEFSLRIIRLFREIQKDSVGKVISQQILRSGTSIGANVHEAQGTQSHADFIAKMSIARKEACETAYWLQLLDEAHIVESERLAPLRDEANQLVRILSAITKKKS